jgi:HlyD family secretion protein
MHFGLVLTAAIAGVAAARAEEKSAQPDQQATSSVIVTQAKHGCFSQRVSITGFLFHSQQAIVTFELENYQVMEVAAQEGERVNTGTRLVRLDHVGSVAPPAPGQPETPATVTLSAPAGGRIESVAVKVGDVVSPKGGPLFTIAASDEIEMEADVPALFLADIAKEKDKNRPVQARVMIGGDQADAREVIGRVKRVSSEVNKNTQLGHVRILLAPDGALHAGAFVGGTIDAGESCGVSVPSTAVNYGSDGTTVQVVRAMVVETRRVHIGLVSDLDVEIKEGVLEGEVIIAHAGTTLRDGDHVTATLEDTRRTERH